MTPAPRINPRRARRPIAAITWTLTGILALSTLTSSGTELPVTWDTPDDVPVVSGTDAEPALVARDINQINAGLDTAKLPAPRWPEASNHDVALKPGIRLAAERSVISIAQSGSQGSEPVTSVNVEILDRVATAAAGQTDALLFKVRRTDGGADSAVSVQVDYAAFAHAYGGDWSSRLALWSLPDCDGCRAVKLVTTNNSTAGLAVAEVPVSGKTSLVALAAETSGSSGDYSASTLAPSFTWSSGSNSGDFTWSYPMTMPSPVGTGPVPTVALSYSSASVDGRSEATNNQPGLIGEGFSYNPGFIERRYVPCSDDMDNGNNAEKTGDKCWKIQNASLSMDGRGGEFVEDAKSGVWRLKNDDASKIELLKDTSNADNNNEYWKLTTSNGTQYFFGLNRLPGWTSSKDETNSVATVPVAGNHSNEPCHATAFQDSFCDQGYRWMLDYVVDVHGNTASYWYSRTTNEYAKRYDSGNPASYTRDILLSRIDYGTDRRDDTEFSGNAPARVNFSYSDRCLSGCTTKDEAHWPDTPWDLECSGDTCTENWSPSFWTSKRLTKVATSVWDVGLGVYSPIDSWGLAHSFPNPGDGTRAGLWLDSIVHTGHLGGDLPMPPIEFDWSQMHNRVDYADGLPSMNWMRLSTIWTETGGQISVGYTPRECSNMNVPASTDDNSKRCYPVKVPKQTDPDTLELHWYHKYLVTSVTEHDQLTSASKVTSYEYVGTPAWRYASPDVFVEDKFRTWSDYRGYEAVLTRIGQPGDQSLVETKFFRGMNGDKFNGGTRTVTVSASIGEPIVDDNLFSGMVRETTTYNGTSDKAVSRTVYEPWRSPTATATRTVAGDTIEARYVRSDAVTYRQTALDAGRGWRTTKTTNSIDDYAMVDKVSDEGDLAVTGDEKCIRTSYARNTDNNLLTPVARAYTYAMPCTATPTTEDDVVNDTRYSFDGKAFGLTPSRGLVTTTETAKAWSNGSSAYIITATSKYDSAGRVIESTDVKSAKTTTAFTPANGGPVVKVITTNPLGWSTTSVRDLKAQEIKFIDANGWTAEVVYDPLGRLTKVWQANRPRSDANYANAPTIEYTYTIAKDGKNSVSTKAINAKGTYTTTYALLDGLLRQRQTQSLSPGAGAGRIVTDTLYDTHGRAYATYGPYVAPGAPSGALYDANQGEVVRRTITEFDRADRTTAQLNYDLHAELWRTTTSYGGDRTTTIPPAGGIPTTTITDAQGSTIELRRHLTADATGSYKSIKYDYDRKNQLETVTGIDSAVWTYEYDFRGRKTATTDPDSGKTMSEYNDAGELTATTDARGERLVFTYDLIGRKIGLYDDVEAPEKLRASWRFDTMWTNQVAKGQPAGWSRFDNGNEYRYDINGYNQLLQPVGWKYTIPAAETGVAGTYAYSQSYGFDGTSPTSYTVPMAGGLGRETTTINYDATTGLPATLTGGLSSGGYVSGTVYNGYGELQNVTYKHGLANTVEQNYWHDDATGRLTRTTVLAASAATRVSDTNYAYNPAGNVTSISEHVTADTQCYTYDELQRLIEAWTPSDADCRTDPEDAVLGGAAPYRHAYTFDDGGSRRSLTDYANGRSTTYKQEDSAHLHAVTTATTTQTSGSSQSNTYQYDTAGNLINRTIGADVSQSFAWDTEGRLDTITDSSGVGTSEQIYTAEGERLIRKDAKGSTLYLPGQEIRYDTATKGTSCSRYYSYAGSTFAVRSTANGLDWTFNDHQGTATTTIGLSPQTVKRRYQDPYGNARGRAPVAWPSERGFQNGVNDPSGLTHIGAREYDPTLGRFISDDPITDTTDSQQMHGYTYSSASPLMKADPSGLREVFMGSGGRERTKSQMDEDYYNPPPDDLPDVPFGGSGGWGLQPCYGAGLATYCPGAVPEGPQDWDYAINFLSEPGCPGMVGDECGKGPNSMVLLQCWLNGSSYSSGGSFPSTCGSDGEWNFKNGDWITEALQGSEAMEQMRLQFAAEFDADPHMGSYGKREYNEPLYQILGDPAWFATGGNAGTNGAVAFIGGFKVTPKVVSYGKDAISVQWTVRNQTDIESISHAGPVELPGFNNQPTGSPLGTVTQNITWTETISFTKG